MSKKEFGEYLRKLRNDRGYSLGDLADGVGVTPYYISYIENGKKTNPSKKIIANIFVKLKMTKAEIERFLDLHGKANGCVSYDIVEYIMSHDELREMIRLERDDPNTSPDWDDFINNFMINNK